MDSVLPEDRSNPDKRSRKVLRAIGHTVGAASLVFVILAAVSSVVVTHLPGACNACHDDWVRENHVASTHASVRCLDCHPGHSAFGGLGGAAHVLEGIISPPRAAGSAFGTVRSATCLDCHPQGDAFEVVISRGVRMSHAGLSDGGYSCTDCHEGVVHGTPDGKLAVPTMGMCAKCHDGSNAMATCDTCHPERSPDGGERLGDAEWALTHGADWERAHGLGDITTCGLCHEPSRCAGCHGTPLPHDSDFGITHGEEAMRVEEGSCTTCHTRAYCSSCHGIDMPHPQGFLAAHSGVAAGLADERCLACHVRANCNECHERHTHPGSRHRLRPPTGMYEAAPR